MNFKLIPLLVAWTVVVLTAYSVLDGGKPMTQQPQPEQLTIRSTPECNCTSAPSSHDIEVDHAHAVEQLEPAPHTSHDIEVDHAHAVEQLEPAPHNPAALLYSSEGHGRLLSKHLNDDGLAPLSRWAQEYIHSRQHVADCAQAQIMVTHGYDSGFGSEMHVLGGMLAFALDHNHTLVASPHTCRAFTSECDRGCACLMQPLSNCEYRDIAANHPNHTTLSFGSLHIGTTTTVAAQSSLRMVEDLPSAIRHTVPGALAAALRSKIPSITDAQMKYWWRTQSVAYIMRFNDETIQAVALLRKDQAMHYYSSKDSSATPMPFPLPANTIAVHIRGGDKSQEMTLVPPSKYIEAAIGIIQNMPLSFSSRTIFVSADDESAITEARALAENARFEFAYSRIPRGAGGHSFQVWKQQGNVTERFYTHLLQLLLSLEADAWIGTRASNWNRLIDELRCVWVDKCRQQYTEVGDSYEDYNW